MINTMIDSAIKIVESLIKSGHEAYFVGGAVRDVLEGRDPSDIDIATSATPDEVEGIFEKTLPLGKEFGVVVVKLDGHNFEVATMRKDIGTSDHRRPGKVEWAGVRQDAGRRDFTINALFYNPLDKKVLDFFGGQDDLREKTIKFIGNPEGRIEEDYLRMLRAIRLKNTLGFEYDEATWEAIKEHASSIASVSSQRIRDELNKMLVHGSRAASLWDMDKSGMLAVIVPEIDALHGIDQSWKFHGEGDVFTHVWLAVKALAENVSLAVVWGTLLHDIGKPPTKGSVPDKRHGGQRIG